MDVKTALLVGIIIGIVLFFVLERTGLLDKWFNK